MNLDRDRGFFCAPAAAPQLLFQCAAGSGAWAARAMDALTIRTSPVLLCCFLSLFLNQLTFFCLAERGRVADFLLQHNYHLTALEFHQELVLEGNAVSGHTPRTKCNLTVSPVLVALLTRRRGCLGWQAEVSRLGEFVEEIVNPAEQGAPAQRCRQRHGVPLNHIVAARKKRTRSVSPRARWRGGRG